MGLSPGSLLPPFPFDGDVGDPVGIGVGTGVSVGVGVYVGGIGGTVAARITLSGLVKPTDSPTAADIQPKRPSAVLTTYHKSIPLFLPMITTFSPLYK